MHIFGEGQKVEIAKEEQIFPDLRILLSELRKDNNLLFYYKIFERVGHFFGISVSEPVFWKKIWYYSGLSFEDTGEHIVFLVFLSFARRQLFVVKFYLDETDVVKLNLLGFYVLSIRKVVDGFIKIVPEQVKLFFPETGRIVTATNEKEVFIREVVAELEKEVKKIVS